MDTQNIQNLVSQLEQVVDLKTLQSIYDQLLGKNGIISAQFKTMGSLDPEQRKTQGQVLSDYKTKIESIYNSKLDQMKMEQYDIQLSQDIVDITLDSHRIDRGYNNLLATTRRDVEDIFAGLGFDIFYGDAELVDKYDNFESLNIPLTHPATEIHDTIYSNTLDHRSQNYVLRTHTTANYNKIISKIGPECKFIIPGHVYRFEKTDASHDTMFRQVDGAVIGRDISIAHFKGLMKQVLSKVMQKEVNIRLRPAYFPFVEPGFEIDVECPESDSDLFKLSKGTGRLEVLGAGMIHPHVLREAGVDPDVYTGFAFGRGLSRLVAIRYNIQDIRLFTNGDLRFLHSFG